MYHYFDANATTTPYFHSFEEPLSDRLAGGMLPLVFITGEDNGAGKGWSGDFEIPEIGDCVRAKFNNLGCGFVTGYFVEHGYLGIIVDPINPPQWWVGQNCELWTKEPYDNPKRFGYHLYGAEAEKADQLKIVRPSQERRFALAYARGKLGPDYIDDIRRAWMNGNYPREVGPVSHLLQQIRNDIDDSEWTMSPHNYIV